MNIQEKKLTKTQHRALAKLNGDWQSAYGLQESLSTLNALWKMGLIERNDGPGAIWSPRTGILYRMLENKPRENH